MGGDAMKDLPPIARASTRCVLALQRLLSAVSPMPTELSGRATIPLASAIHEARSALNELSVAFDAAETTAQPYGGAHE